MIRRSWRPSASGQYSRGLSTVERFLDRDGGQGPSGGKACAPSSWASLVTVHRLMHLFINDPSNNRLSILNPR